MNRLSFARLVKTTINGAARRVGYRIERTGDGLPDIDANATAMIATVRPYTALSAERLVAFRDAVTYVERFGLGGAIVECGVWRGGAIMAAAMTLLEIGVQNRDIYLFDTFEGMTAPTLADRDAHGVPAADQMDAIMMAASLEEVQRNVYSTGYPVESIHFVKGPVEETIPAQSPDRIAILRLDTDFYESTRHELEHLVPKLVPNGVLIIDDYGHWRGARQAVDEFMALTRRPILLARTDETGRMAVAP